MPFRPTASRPNRRSPLALVAGHEEWSLRSIESVLEAHRIDVLRAHSGREAIERFRAARPDILLIDAALPDIDGITASRLLRAELSDSSTPILLMTAEPWSRTARLEAFRAGAWDVLTMPLDAEELALRVELLAQARLETQWFAAAGLVDEITGLYNAHGLYTRLTEIVAEGTRRQEALACIVLAPVREAVIVETPVAHPKSASLDQMARLIRGAIRAYDVLGRVGPGEFVIASPGSGRTAALAMASRIAAVAQTALGGVAGDGDATPVRVGCYVIDDLSRESVSPVVVLGRATMALRRAESAEEAERVHFYQAAEGD